MEKFQELREIAKKKVQVADHILTQTYPLVKDTKLLLVVMENIFLALTNAIGSLLYYERLFKRIPPFQDNFSSKFNMFRAKCIDRYKINKEHVTFIQDIKDIILEHKKSPVEFVRKDRFVICSDNYSMKTISVEQMKDHLAKAKLFIHNVGNITAKEEAIFNSH
jgi:hypothetical protein